MKNSIFVMLLGLFSFTCAAQSKKIDSVAVKKDSIVVYTLSGDLQFWGKLFELLRQNGKQNSMVIDDYIELIQRHLTKKNE